MTSRARQARIDEILERELFKQRRWSLLVQRQASPVVAEMIARSALVKERLEEWRPVGLKDQVLEIGPGPNGLIFFFEAERKFAVDPLAGSVMTLFPQWSQRAELLTAWGEALPYPDSYFDYVLCDNVLSQADDPTRILGECSRVLSPGGLLYLSVEIHDRIAIAAALLSSLLKIATKHAPTIHQDRLQFFTTSAIRRMLGRLPFEIVAVRNVELDDLEATPAELLRRRYDEVRSSGTRLEIIARRDSSPVQRRSRAFPDSS